MRSKQQGVECMRCEMWTHAGCGGAEYKWLSDHEEEPWFCQPTTDISLTSMGTNSVSESNGCAPFESGHGYLNCQVLNARSIVNKRLDLRALLFSENLNAFAITETFLSEDILDSELVDETAFTIFRWYHNRHGGGIMLVLRNYLSAVHRTDLETDCEILWVEIIIASFSILFGVFYRAPGSGSAPLNTLHHFLSALPVSHPVILCGDFNLPGREVELLSDLILLTQLVQQPTRGENVLDLLLTNSPGMVSRVDVVDGLPGSDHEALQFSIKSIK